MQNFKVKEVKNCFSEPTEKAVKKVWHKSLQALNLCIQIPLIRDSPKTRKKVALRKECDDT